MQPVQSPNIKNLINPLIMCLGIPIKILSIKGNKAIADFQGKKQEFNTDLVKNIKPNDYALVSNGFIVKKISAKEAEKIFNIIYPDEGGN